VVHEPFLESQESTKKPLGGLGVRCNQRKKINFIQQHKVPNPFVGSGSERHRRIDTHTELRI
jgi:hypothetical protein